MYNNTEVELVLDNIEEEINSCVRRLVHHTNVFAQKQKMDIPKPVEDLQRVCLTVMQKRASLLKKHFALVDKLHKCKTDAEREVIQSKLNIVNKKQEKLREFTVENIIKNALK